MTDESINVIVAKMSKDIEHIIYLLEDVKKDHSNHEKRIVILEDDMIDDGKGRMRKVEERIGQISTIGAVLIFLIGIVQFVLGKYF